MTEPRVVILSGPGEVFGDEADSPLPQGLRYDQVSSGYEAAAELLSEPAAALVVNLDRFTDEDGALLSIARERGVEIFGVGSLHADLSAESLSGMRLESLRDLIDLLAELARREAPAPGVRLSPAKPPEEYRSETPAAQPHTPLENPEEGASGT